jgi:hypothetical protein
VDDDDDESAVTSVIIRHMLHGSKKCKQCVQTIDIYFIFIYIYGTDCRTSISLQLIVIIDALTFKYSVGIMHSNLTLHERCFIWRT